MNKKNTVVTVGNPDSIADVFDDSLNLPEDSFLTNTPSGELIYYPESSNISPSNQKSTFYSDYRKKLHDLLHHNIDLLKEKYSSANKFLAKIKKNLTFGIRGTYDTTETLSKHTTSNIEQQSIILLLRSLENCAYSFTIKQKTKRQKDKHASYLKKFTNFFKTEILSCNSHRSYFSKVILKKSDSLKSLQKLSLYLKSDFKRYLAYDDIPTFAEYKATKENINTNTKSTQDTTLPSQASTGFKLTYQTHLESVTKLISYKYRQALFDKTLCKISLLEKTYPNAEYFLSEVRKSLNVQVKPSKDPETFDGETFTKERQKKSISLLLTGIEKCASTFTTNMEFNESLTKKYLTALNEVMLKKKKPIPFVSLIHSRSTKIAAFNYSIDTQATLTLSFDDIQTFAEFKQTQAKIELETDGQDHYVDEEADALPSTSTKLSVIPIGESTYSDVPDSSLFLMKDSILPTEKVITTNNVEKTPIEQPSIVNNSASLTRYCFRQDIYKLIKSSLENLTQEYSNINFFKQLESSFDFNVGAGNLTEKEEKGLQNVVVVATKMVHCLEMCKELAPMLKDKKLLNFVDIYSQKCKLIQNKNRTFYQFFRYFDPVNDLYSFLEAIFPNFTSNIRVDSYSEWQSNSYKFTLPTTPNPDRQNDDKSYFCYQYRKHIYAKFHDSLNILIKIYPDAADFLYEVKGILISNMKHRADPKKVTDVLYTTQKIKKSIIYLLQILEQSAIKLTQQKDNHTLLQDTLKKVINVLTPPNLEKQTFINLLYKQKTSLESLHENPIFCDIKEIDLKLSTKEILSFKEYRKEQTSQADIADKPLDSPDEPKINDVATSNNNFNNSYFSKLSNALVGAIDDLAETTTEDVLKKTSVSYTPYKNITLDSVRSTRSNNSKDNKENSTYSKTRPGVRSDL